MKRALALAFGSLLVAACGRVDDDRGDDQPTCGAPLRDPAAIAPEIARPRPELGALHLDPALGGCLSRVTDHAELPEEASLQAALGRQALSSDGAFVITSSGLVLDTRDFSAVTTLPNAPAVWAPDHAHAAYYIDGSSLYLHHVDTDERELMHAFSEYDSLDARAGLRDPTLDGSAIALVGVRPQDGASEIFVWDLESREKSAVRAGPVDVVERATAPLWVSVSPSGHSVVVGWPDAGPTAFHGIELYDSEMALRSHVSDGAGSADLAIDSEDREWLVEWSPAQNGPALRKLRIDTNAPNASELIRFDGFANIRISCRAPGRNVCAISAHGAISGPWHPLQDELFVVELDGTSQAPHVERLAHHESAPEFVAAQSDPACALSPDAVLPNPVLSHDARSVLFTSNWNAHCYGELYRAVR